MFFKELINIRYSLFDFYEKTQNHVINKLRKDVIQNKFVTNVEVLNSVVSIIFS